MASVHGPQVPRHHSPFRRVHRTNYQQKPSSSATGSTAGGSTTSTPSGHPHHGAPDTYYGHEETSKICSRFVAHTFNCPEILPPLPPPPQSPPQSSSCASATVVQPPPPPPPSIPATLAHFVAYALHRTRLHASVTFTALALLHRLKTRFPAARGSSGHRLFLSAFMIASKVVCDDTYSNKSWAVVGQGMFALREINQMEREMCAYLEWQLNIPCEDLCLFEVEVRRIYSRPPPYTHGVTINLIAGVGGANAPNARDILPGLAPLAITGVTSIEEKERRASSPQRVHQLPTPTDTGSTSVPFVAPGKPVLLPISTAVVSSKPAGSHLPSPPSSPPSPTCGSDCTNSSTDDLCAPVSTGSPSPTSSEDSALPTPPNSAGAAQPRAYPAYGKITKSYSLPGVMAGFGGLPPAPVSVHRVSVPPAPAGVFAGVQSLHAKAEPVVSSVSAAGGVGNFGGVGSYGADEDGDALMALDDEKRLGTAYYATVHRPASREPREKTVVRERERSRMDGTHREREGKDRRNFRTFTVPCTW